MQPRVPLLSLLVQAFLGSCLGMNWSHGNNGLWLTRLWQDSNLTQPETGDLMLLLARWKGMGVVFELIPFTHKTVDSALCNSEMEHGSRLTSRIFRLLGDIHLWEYEVFQTLLFVSPKSSPVGETLCMCPLPTPCTAVTSGRQNFASEEQVFY